MVHLAVSPVLLDTGEHLFAELILRQLGYMRTEHVAAPNTTCVVFTQRR